MEIIKQTFSKLPDDVLEQIKKYIAVNPPQHLTLYDVIYFQHINKMNTKQLIKCCNNENVSKSRKGVNNQYVKRLNLIEKYLGRKVEDGDMLVITFTKGRKHLPNYANLSLDEY